MIQPEEIEQSRKDERASVYCLSVLWVAGSVCTLSMAVSGGALTYVVGVSGTLYSVILMAAEINKYVPRGREVE